MEKYGSGRGDGDDPPRRRRRRPSEKLLRSLVAVGEPSKRFWLVCERRSDGCP